MLINQKLLPPVEDSGWIEITPTLGTAGTGYYVPAYRKIGNIVYLKGIILGITATNSAIFTLPSGFYNSSNRYTFLTSNDAQLYNEVRVSNSGNVILVRTTGTIADGIQIFMDGISFIVD